MNNETKTQAPAKANAAAGAQMTIAGDVQLPAIDLSKDSDIMSLMLDAQKYDMCLRLAKIIATNNLMPKHLTNNESVCFQVVIQSLQWGMNCFAVAPKTYAIGQKLSFESNLVNSVINKLAPTKDRLHYDWFGDWDKYIENGFKKDDEKGLGVNIWATLKGEEKPRTLEVKMNSIAIRNSTNWKADPKQQISYVAVQRWSRLFCPDVIMGIYSADEMPADTKPPMKNITPQGATQTEKLKNTLKANADEEAPADHGTFPEGKEQDAKTQDAFINRHQQKAIFAQIGDQKINKDFFKKWLETFFGLTSTNDIPAARYDEIISLIQKGCPEI